MTLPVYIPSLGRSESFTRRTLAWMPGNRPIYLVTPVVEAEQYAAKLPQGTSARILACRENGRSTMSAVRKWIANHAHRHGHPYFLMLDDDFRFFRRREDGSGYLRKADQPGDMEECLNVTERYLSEGYAAVGISSRQGNNRMPACEYNTRINGAMAFHTEAYLACQHERLTVMEDFDVILQLLRSGKPNAKFSLFAYDQDKTQAPGGCSTYRTHQNHEESAYRLSELHPGLVKLREKRNRTGGAFGTRTEVTIYWKRAYREGLTK